MKKYKSTIILSIIITLVSIFSGAINWKIQFVIVSLLYFLSTLFLLKNEKIEDKKIITILILLLPFVLLYNYTAISNIFKFNRFHTLPIGLSPIVFVLIAILYSKFKLNKKKIVLVSLFIGLLTYIGMANWLVFLNNNENPINKIFPELIITDINNNIINLKKGKIIVLDLWATNCGSCIKKFPKFEDLKLEYKNDKNVEFYTLNLPLKRDSTLNIKKYVDKYKFKSLFAKKLDSWKKLNNRTVPKLLVLDKELRIIYKGSMNDKWYIFYNNIHSIIKNSKI